MGVIETNKPVSIGIVQGEGVAQAVGTLRRRLHAADLEFQPVAFFEMVHASIERQQKFERVFVYGTPSMLSSPEMIPQDATVFQALIVNQTFGQKKRRAFKGLHLFQKS